MKLKKVAGSGMDKAYVGPSLSPTFHPAPPPGFCFVFVFVFYFVARFFQSARSLIFFSFA